MGLDRFQHDEVPGALETYIAVLCDLENGAR
jgi:hypothetical protein